MDYDVIVIGGGLSGLTAASLLAKRKLNVLVIDKNDHVGGSCGAFKRGDALFDQGAAMLYGFGEAGFNAHRFVFNCLEEPIDIIRHDMLYCVNFKGRRIRFWQDLDRFIEELKDVFPNEEKNIRRFYDDMYRMYAHVMIETPQYTSPDETDVQSAWKSLMKHPISYIRFISYLNRSAKDLLTKYFKDPEIFQFFDKLTSTYCYVKTDEAPAILAAVMFVDNHVGGSYYPAGSSAFLPGKLEKVIEENGGEILTNQEVVKILFENGKPAGVRLKSGECLYADNLVYSGTVWNLYGKLIEKPDVGDERIAWAARQVPTYPSVVLYALVDRKVIPDETAAIEMLIGNPDAIDESEVTAYIMSKDDRTLCDENSHVIVAIGPTFANWETASETTYLKMKEAEKARILAILDQRFAGFIANLHFAEVATPKTIERYTMKNHGAVAGPKQMLGQHLLKRLHARSEWDTLYCCGESTVMGTGTPAVTTSGISAANAILKKIGQEPFTYKPAMRNYVRIVEKPFMPRDLYRDQDKDREHVMRKASLCEFCEHPSCSDEFDIPSIMRKTMVGNFVGTKKIIERYRKDHRGSLPNLDDCELRCIRQIRYNQAVDIKTVIDYTENLKGEDRHLNDQSNFVSPKHQQ